MPRERATHPSRQASGCARNSRSIAQERVDRFGIVMGIMMLAVWAYIWFCEAGVL